MVYKCQHNLSLADIASLTILTTEASIQQSVLAQKFFLHSKTLKKVKHICPLWQDMAEAKRLMCIKCIMSLKSKCLSCKILGRRNAEAIKKFGAKMVMSMDNVSMLCRIPSSVFLPPSALHQY